MNDPIPHDRSDNDTAWERVNFVSDYYDVPLLGVAMHRDAPHVFMARDEIRRPVVDDEDGSGFHIDYVYSLHPVSEGLLSRLEERHAIFERWHQAYARGQSTIESHPALPADRERYVWLNKECNEALAKMRQDELDCVMIGNFRGGRSVPDGFSRWSGFDVRWSPVSGA